MFTPGPLPPRCPVQGILPLLRPQLGSQLTELVGRDLDFPSAGEGGVVEGDRLHEEGSHTTRLPVLIVVERCRVSRADIERDRVHELRVSVVDGDTEVVASVREAVPLSVELRAARHEEELKLR